MSPAGQKTRQAFLDLLLEYSEKDPTITNEDILEEVNTFMFAGHDTTTAAMNWFLYVMGTHREIQASARLLRLAGVPVLVFLVVLLWLFLVVVFNDECGAFLYWLYCC